MNLNNRLQTIFITNSGAPSADHWSRKREIRPPTCYGTKAGTAGHCSVGSRAGLWIGSRLGRLWWSDHES